MKLFFILSCTALSVFSFAQSGTKRQKLIDESAAKQSVEVINDSAFYAGKPVCMFTTMPNSLGMVKQVKSFSNKAVAQITNQSLSMIGPKMFYVEFEGVADKAQLSEKNFSTLLKLLLNQKVLSDKGELDKAAAEKFTAQHKYVAPPPSTYSEPASTNTSATQTNSGTAYNTNSSGNNSTSHSSAPPPPANVSFTLKNTGGNSVRVFIGTKPKYGSGTTGNISGNSINSMHGTVGDQICIVDGSDNPISCMTISNGMGTVYINKAGTGFGDN